MTMSKSPAEIFGYNFPDIRETQLLIVGGGPAGLSAALQALKLGLRVTLVESGLELGGQLVKQTHKFFGSSLERAGTRGFRIAQELIKELTPFKENGQLEVYLNTTAIAVYPERIVLLSQLSGKVFPIKPKAMIIATGAQERMLPFPNNDLPGIYGAGGIQTLMNQYGVKPGERALIVGAGNIGLIVAYQLLQAGVEVIAILEAMDRIGGWWVHAAKVRRYGVPILLRHTISRAIGKDKVEGAVIAEITPDGLKDKYQVECDLIGISVGLTPTVDLLRQANVKMKYVAFMGGFVPLRDREMRTSQSWIWVAGDSAGIEEASTAMIEGQIASTSIAKWLGYISEEEAKREIDQLWARLGYLREAEVSSKVRKGLEEVMVTWEG